MNTKKLLLSLFVSFTLLNSDLIQGIENSIIPKISECENSTQTPSHKYSKNQYSEICNILQLKDERIRLVSFNMLFNLHDNNLKVENRWPQRLPRLVEIIQEMHPDIIGAQELYPDTLKDLLRFLGEDFAFYTKPCEDGELNGIFYRKSRFELIQSHVWYMNPNSSFSSSDTLTMVQLKDLKTGKVIAVFNTHLAFSKIDKREYQARFIAEKIASFADELPILLTGDFNTFPNRPDLIKLPFYDGDYIHQILTKQHLKDAREISLLGHLGPLSTFTNQDQDPSPFKGTGTPGVFLDHIYVSNPVSVLIHAVQPGTINGYFPSDHMPVIIDFVIK